MKIMSTKMRASGAHILSSRVVIHSSFPATRQSICEVHVADQ